MSVAPVACSIAAIPPCVLRDGAEFILGPAEGRTRGHLLRMTLVFHGIKENRHPEEPAQRASRRTHGVDPAASFKLSARARARHRAGSAGGRSRSEERRVGKECRSGWSPGH